MRKFTPFLLWGLFSLVLGSWLAVSFNSEDQHTPFVRSTVFLPDQTTHGHHQIEMKCSACHTPFEKVSDQACLSCHEQELAEANDTHPAAKFSDPSKANLLEHVNARSCVACHREHVPEETHAMGLTVPEDFCFHCHQEIGEDRPSHREFDFHTCASAGCHNYHDNRALYERYLTQHHGEPDLRETPRVPTRTRPPDKKKRLTVSQANPPEGYPASPKILNDWAETAHALAGVNCADCHMVKQTETDKRVWHDKLGYQSCSQCHKAETDGFLGGKHGMRLALELPPMTPKMARLPMHQGVEHRSLSCNSCHTDHRFNRREAAVKSCLNCHNDEHTNAYQKSSHYILWQQEVAGDAPAGSGVSCATCHLPRIKTDDGFQVQHNQNWNLQPNETMGRSVCLNCHGLEYSLSALADSQLIERCFQGEPARRIPSVQMAQDWLELKRRQRERRRNSK